MVYDEICALLLSAHLKPLLHMYRPLDIKPAKGVKTQPSYCDIQHSQTLSCVTFPNLGHLDVAAK